MNDPIATVSVTEFKAHCLKLFADLSQRRLKKVIVTRHGKVVGEVLPPGNTLPPIYGAHPGSVTVPPGIDLTEPVFSDEEFDVGKDDPC
jgi:hypothetical protein